MLCGPSHSHLTNSAYQVTVSSCLLVVYCCLQRHIFQVAFRKEKAETSFAGTTVDPLPPLNLPTVPNLPDQKLHSHLTDIFTCCTHAALCKPQCHVTFRTVCENLEAVTELLKVAERMQQQQQHQLTVRQQQLVAVLQRQQNRWHKLVQWMQQQEQQQCLQVGSSSVSF